MKNLLICVLLFVVMGWIVPAEGAENPLLVRLSFWVPSERLADFFQSRDGRIWFSTEKGVSRFDLDHPAHSARKRS